MVCPTSAVPDTTPDCNLCISTIIRFSGFLMLAAVSLQQRHFSGQLCWEDLSFIKNDILLPSVYRVSDALSIFPS